MQQENLQENIVDKFKKERERLNEIVLNRADTVIKRFYSLDSQMYRSKVLKDKTKEMLGLVSSLVLRCDDCVKYHLSQCFELNITSTEIIEVLSVGLIVGGSIVIPHLRRAIEFWSELEIKRFSDLYYKIKQEYDKVIGVYGNKDEKIKNDVKNNFLNYICEICSKTIPYYNWFGFYLVDTSEANMLYLGPFVGEPTEHTRIPFGRGICGQAAEKKDTIIVQDISEEKNYLACSLKVKSELVTPIIKDEKILGEVDIDSHYLNAFSNLDKEFIEKIANLLSSIL